MTENITSFIENKVPLVTKKLPNLDSYLNCELLNEQFIEDMHEVDCTSHRNMLSETMIKSFLECAN